MIRKYVHKVTHSKRWFILTWFCQLFPRTLRSITVVLCGRDLWSNQRRYYFCYGVQVTKYVLLYDINFSKLGHNLCFLWLTFLSSWRCSLDSDANIYGDWRSSGIFFRTRYWPDEANVHIMKSSKAQIFYIANFRSKTSGNYSFFLFSIISIMAFILMQNRAAINQKLAKEPSSKITYHVVWTSSFEARFTDLVKAV